MDVWYKDETDPFQTAPIADQSWQAESKPTTYPHELCAIAGETVDTYYPRDGQVPVKGVTQGTNEVLLPWLETELAEIVGGLPPALELPTARLSLLYFVCSRACSTGQANALEAGRCPASDPRADDSVAQKAQCVG